MQTVKKGLKIRIYPNKTIQQALNQNIGNSRFVWNQLLSEYKKLYPLFKNKGYKINPNPDTFNTLLNMLKKEYSFLTESESSSLQQVYRDLIEAFKRFFKTKNRYPKFKSKKHPKQSFRIANNNNIKVNDNQIIIPKHGKVRFRTSKKYKKILHNNKIISMTIKHYNNKWYAVILVKADVEPLPLTYKEVGIDLGLESLITTSDGVMKDKLNCRYEESMKKKYQKIMSRRKHGSKRYYKALNKYYKWTDKINNKKDDYYHKITTDLVKDYDLIGAESLNVKNMIKNRHLSHSIHDIRWGEFLGLIEYKCEWYGKKLVQIDQWYPSSQLCSNCGFKNVEVKNPGVRHWICPDCGTEHDRDLNAACNILNEAKCIRTGGQPEIAQ